MDDTFELKDTIDYKRLNDLGDANDEILIGYPTGMMHINDDADSETTDMAEDARKLYFGAEDIPARPFLTDGMMNGQPEIQQAIEKHMKKLVDTGKGLLKRVATVCVASVQDFVREGGYKDSIPNSQATIDAKSTRANGEYLLSDIPLIDSAQMINSLTSVINGELSSVKEGA